MRRSGVSKRMGKRLFRHRIDGNLLLVAAQTLEADNAAHQREQGVVLADAHVLTGMNLGAALTNENVASLRKLTVGTLRAKALGFAVAAAACRVELCDGSLGAVW